MRTKSEDEKRIAIRTAMLPYGKWTCADGREVLFNRNYRPIWQRDAAGVVSAATPGEYIKWKMEHFFYDDGTPDKAGAAIPIFEEFTGREWDWELAKAALGGFYEWRPGAGNGRVEIVMEGDM